MAYLSGFENDIFISYAHIDNLSVGNEKGWVNQFCEHLEVRLWKRFGKKGAVKIWWDPALDGNQLFDKTIQEAVNKSALFVALTSNGYIESDYCRQEINWFCRKARSEPIGLAAGDRYRLFNLLLNNIPFNEWPEEYDRTSGLPFHDAERDDQFGEPSVPGDKLFQQQLRDLVDALYKTICSIEEQHQSANIRQTETVSDAPTDSFTVFLADTSDSLRSVRRRVQAELEQQGIRVVANIPPPYEAAEHDECAGNIISRAGLSVHLLDNLSGREIEGSSGKTYPQRQAELALERAKAQLIWAPQSLNVASIEDDIYRGFIDQLENGARTESSYCFIRESSTAITREIIGKIDQINSAPEPELALSATLVDTHLKDQLHALELSQLLLQKNVQPYINPEEDNPRKNMKIFEERLKQVSRLIIIYGQVGEEWVLERLGAALQIAIVERCPLKACGIYFAPPRKKSADSKFNLGFIPVHLFDDTDISNPQTLASFIQAAE